MQSCDIAFWKETIHDEIGSIMGNDMWALSDLPSGCKPLGIDKFKARLVIQSFRRKKGINYFHTHALITRITTIRLLLALAAIHNLVIHQMDVKKTDQNQVDKTKKFLSSRFSMKDMGEADVILGIKIKRVNKEIVITQPHYIEKILKKFNREDCSLVSTLMNLVENFKPNTGKPVDQLEYSRAIGCLMYVMISTRPDIAYAVGRLSRFTSNPSRQYWKAITRVFKYLRGTKDYGVSYVGYPSVLEGYSDASWINHVEDLFSTSGWVFPLGGGAISWASKKQTCITRSTIEFEFVALAAVGKEAEWLRNLIHEIPIWPKPITPISIRCDSAPSMARKYSKIYNGKSRHLGSNANIDDLLVKLLNKLGVNTTSSGTTTGMNLNVANMNASPSLFYYPHPAPHPSIVRSIGPPPGFGYSPITQPGLVQYLSPVPAQQPGPILVPRPPDTSIVRCVWLFCHTYMADGTLSRYKARLVANGSTQLEGVDVDETFSLVVKPGVSVTRDSSRLFLSQKKYALEILDRAHMANCNPSRTPIDTESKLGSDSDPVFYLTLYRSLAALKRILRCVCGALDYELQLFSSSTIELVAYSDANWDGCPTTRRSTSGYYVFIGNNLLSWSSKHQPTISRSSAEAEYRGIANAVVETCWLRKLLRDLHTPLSSATLVYFDNASVVYLSCNLVQHQRTKHIEVDIHFVRDLVAIGQVRCDNRGLSRNLFLPLDNPEHTIRRRSRTDPTLLNDFEMAAEGSGDLPVPDLRTMEELCHLSLNGRGRPIAPIAIQATNFRLKNDMIQQSIKVNGVTDDALSLYLFPHSLTHHATAWFDRLPRNSINTFEQMAKMFIGKYFPPSMVTKLRNEITNFHQRPDESLFKAWECYKLSIDRCPNHNMLPVTQIDTFYNGLTLRHCDTINVVTGGTFMKRRPEECYDLTENMIAYHNDWDTSSQRSESSSSITSSFDLEIIALKAEMAEINKNLMRVLQVNQQVKAVTPNCETCGGPHSFNDCPATVGQTKNVYAAGAYQGNTITNPKEDLKGITTQSGTVYQGPTIPTTSSSLPKVVERETEVTKDTMPPTNNGSTKEVQPLVVQTETPTLNSEPIVAPIIEPVVAPVSASKPNQKPLIPYPSRLHDQKLRDKTNDQREKFFQIFQDLNFNISFVDALILMPKFGSTIKTLLTNKDKLSELARTPLNEHCSAVLLKKLLEKLEDPEKFLIPCDFPRMAECLALADLDHSISRSVGVAEDVFVKVGTFHFPADFVVVDFDADPRVPLILERSFLKTERALIDVFKGELTLRVGKEAITFNLHQTSRYSTNYNDITTNRIDVIDMACEEYSQEVLNFSDVIASGNPTPYYGPIVSTFSSTQTPFGDSDFLLEEGDAFLALEDDPTLPEVDQSYADTE
nr:zinc finger, CCHC-type [Tanacetum cinerariifolium]